MFSRLKKSGKTSYPEFSEDVSGVVKTQRYIVERLDSIEAKLDILIQNTSTDSSETRGMLSKIMNNQAAIYLKLLLARLNFIELSEGRQISVSENEKVELDNSFTQKPQKGIMRLPKLIKVGQENNTTKH